MPLTKQGNFAKKVTDLPDRPSPTYTASDIKAHFQTPADELKVAINKLIDDIQSIVDGSSGADNIGATAIADLTGTSIQALLESLRNKLKDTTDGSSGANFVKATGIEGLEGTTVQELLESLKTYADGINTGSEGLSGHKTASVLDHPDSSVTTPKLAPRSITREKVSPGAIGTNELDPSIFFQPTTVEGVQAKFQSVDEQLAVDAFQVNQFLEMPESYLEIPSPIGNSLTTHPSVIDFGVGKSWNGFRYWMAHTPFPGTQNENPAIAASNDNKNWVLPLGAPNPLVQAPTSGYYSDTEIVYLSDSNKLRIYYRQANSTAGGAQLFYIDSTDGSTWSTPVLSLDVQSNLLSPAIIRENATSWKMWYVESETKIGYRTSTDGVTWSAETPISQPWTNWSAWHIGIVISNDGKYHMLASAWDNIGSGEGTQYRPIIYASGTDGLNWIPNEKPQLIPSGWAGGYLYRPSFIVDESKGLTNNMPYVKVWFSASEEAVANGWHIGYTEGFLMTGDANPSATSENVKRKRTGDYFKLFASNIVAQYAKVSRIVTKRVQIKSDFSKPIIEWFDGRPTRDGGNYLITEYNGSNNANIITYIMAFYDDAGNSTKLVFSPFLNGVTFGSITDPFVLGYLREISAAGNFVITADNNVGARINLIRYDKITGGLTFNSNFIQIKQKPAETTPAPMSLYEDTDGILKYKNSAGVVKNLTS